MPDPKTENEAQIDAIVHGALSTNIGKEFHAWLVNNYLMTPTNTTDPNQALVSHAQACLVAAINSRMRRHAARQEHGRREPGNDHERGPAKRTDKHFGE